MTSLVCPSAIPGGGWVVGAGGFGRWAGLACPTAPGLRRAAPVLDEAGADGDTDAYEDEGAEEFTRLRDWVGGVVRGGDAFL